MDLGTVVGRDVPRETFEKLAAYCELLRTESANHNLISAATRDGMWDRHIVDCAQLLRHARGGRWVDIGSGAGLPGLVIAILASDCVTLIEPRRLRAEFLQSVIDQLDLAQVTVVRGRAGAASGTFDLITGRAVASATVFFSLAHHLSRPDTVWVLPKGRSAQKELDEALATWQGEFRLEPSLTDADASILVATKVRRRAR